MTPAEASRLKTGDVVEVGTVGGPPGIQPPVVDRYPVRRVEWRAHEAFVQVTTPLGPIWIEATALAVRGAR